MADLAKQVAGLHTKNSKEHIINELRTSYALNKTRESVRPVVREDRDRHSCVQVPVFPQTSYTEEIVAMDADDADPDREEKLKAAKEKVGYVYGF